MPAMDDLLPIGRFARLTGLTIGALRHYDELDVLRPADVDRSSGYRRYRRDQLETGRLISRLRDLEVPIDEIRRILSSDDPTEQRRRLAEHRSRVEARTNRLQHQLHVLHQLSTGKEPLVSQTPATVTSLDVATHRQLGVDLFNHVWTLIEKPDRSVAETDEMIHAAHASRYHWSFAGTTANLSRGEWQCARVYSVLGRGEPALWHARRCLELSQRAADAGEADSWDVPSAYEAMARAHAVAGDRAAALEWRDRARAAVAGIAEAHDREIIEGDLATLPL